MENKTSKLPDEDKPDIGQNIENIKQQENNGPDKNKEGGFYRGDKDTNNHKSNHASLGDIGQAENLGYVGNSSEGSRQGLYNPKGGNTFSGQIKGFLKTKKGKYSAGTAIFATIITVVIIGFFSIVSGPFQFIHFAQLLEKFHFSSLTNQSNSRFLRIMTDSKYYASGNVYRTNLGFLGNHLADTFELKLKEQGLSSAYDRLGYSKQGYYVDKTDDNFKGLSDQEIEQNLKTKYGDNITVKTLPGDRLLLEQPDGYAAPKVLVSKLLSGVGYNGVSSFIGARIMATRDGVTLHPLKILDKKLYDKLSKRLSEYNKERVSDDLNGADTNSLLTPEDKSQPGNTPAEQQASAEAGQETSTVSSSQSDGSNASQSVNSGNSNSASSAIDSIKNSLTVKLTGGAAAIAGVMCIARGIAQDSGNIKQHQVVLPLIRTGMRIVSEGSQIQAGQDVDVDQLNADSSQLYNATNHTSWTDSQSVQYNLGQSYNSKTVYSDGNNDKTLSTINAGTPFDAFISGTLGDSLGAVCNVLNSTVGTVGSFVLGILGGPISFIGSIAVSTVLGPPVIDAIAHYLAGDAVDAYASGGKFGNYADYGGHLAANDQAVSDGGGKLTDSQVTALNEINNQQANQEFDQHSLAYRLFNLNDNMSLISSIVDNQSNNFAINLQSFASSSLNIGQSLTNSFSSLFNQTAIASTPNTPFNYGGTGYYGFSEQQMNDPGVQNPYQNADDVAAVLDKNNTNGEPDYISRAKSCFGDTLAQTTVTDSKGVSHMVWDVQFGTDSVNLVSTDYKNNVGSCSDTSDENWAKIKMYIFDTQTIKAADCYGDPDQTISEQTCSEFGLSNNSQSSSGASNNNSNLPTGNSKQLAQQLLPYISKGQIVCGSAAGGSGPSNCSDIQNTANGSPLGGNCQVNALTPNLLTLILSLVQNDNWKLGISAICSDHHLEGDGPYAGHSYGSVADFSIQNGASGAAAAADEKFVNDAAKILLSMNGGSFGQSQCRNPNYPVLNNPKFTTFDDSCTHQHIRAAP